MFDVRKWHRWSFGIGVLILAVVLIWLMGNEQRLCMGVRLLTEKEAAAYTCYRYEDISEQLLFNGEKVAVDTKNHTIYLSQKISDGTKPWQLKGKLSVDSEDHQLFFLKEEFVDMSDAVQRGENFSLLVTDGTDCYMRYRVVFTALPVVCLEGQYSHINEESRKVLEGRLCVWDPEDPAVGRYSVKTTDVQWHLRGGSTAVYAKKSWKLSAKTPGGENRNVSLLGLGADDDWILNAMSMDDTKVKEKVLMQLWNTLASGTEHNLPMSTGEYVEVVINGEYCGVYLLQRRVDKKYLQLEEDDVLLKGKPVWEASAVEDAYEIISSPLSQKQTYQLMRGVWSKTDMTDIVPENFVDVSLLIQLGLLTDNNGYKNMFYVLQNQEDGYAMYMVPWDTDLAFGTSWLNKFIYDKDLNMHTSLYRIEYDGMKKLYPKLDEMMAQRWQKLRTGVFSEEHLCNLIQQAQTELTRTGALVREEERWDQRYAGEDTVEGLYLCIQERLAWLDSIYGQAA